MKYKEIILIAFLGIIASGIFVFSFNFAISGADSIQYDRLGFNLACGRGFSLEAHAPYSPTMFREPGYPVFLAIIFLIFGHNIAAALIIQMLLHALTAILAYIIAKEIFCARTALFSGAIVAVFPTLANMTAYLLSETFFTFLLCLGLYTYNRFIKKGSIMWAIASGGIFGIMSLTKVASLFLPIALGAATIFMIIMKKLSMKKLLICFLLFISLDSLLVSGWVNRNKAVFNISSLTLRGGEALWSRAQKLDDSNNKILATACYSVSEYLGNKIFPGLTEKPERYLFKDFERAEGLRREYTAQGLSDPQIEEIFRREAVSKISKSPLKYISYTFVEAIKMSAFTYLPILNEPVVRNHFIAIRDGTMILSCIKGVMRFIAYPILILSLIVAIKYLKIWDRWLTLSTIIIYFNLVYSFLDAIGRYAVPLIPLYLILAISVFFYQEEIDLSSRK